MVFVQYSYNEHTFSSTCWYDYDDDDGFGDGNDDDDNDDHHGFDD